MTPGSERVVRKKVVASTPVKKVEEKEDVAMGEGKDEKKGKEMVEEKRTRSKVKSKKRGLRKAKLLDSSDDDSSDALEAGETSPVPSKRSRNTFNSGGSGSFAAPSPRVVRKPLPATNTSTSHAPSSSPSEGRNEPPSSIGVRASEMPFDSLMQAFGVNTPEDPYDEHLLSRHQPVVSNPVIEIPDRVKRGFQPRPSREQIHMNIQEKTRKRMQENAQQKLRQSGADNTVGQEVSKRVEHYVWMRSNKSRQKVPDDAARPSSQSLEAVNGFDGGSAV